LFIMPFVVKVGVYDDAFAATALLFEDFDDGVAHGFGEVGGTWAVVYGKYLQSLEDPAGPYRSWVDTLPEYIIEVDCTPLSGEETKVIYAHADTSEDYRVDFWLDACRLCMPAWGETWDTRNFFVGQLALRYNQTYHVKIEVSRAGVKVWLDNVLVHDQPWANAQPLGDAKVGVGTYAGSSRFDNVSVCVPGASPTTLLFEDFNNGVANGFTEVGGTWGIDATGYVQSANVPPGPYRSWANALPGYIVEVDCTPLHGEETKVIYAHADTSEDYRVDFWLDRSRLSIPAWGQTWGSRNVTLGGLTLSYAQTYRVKIEVSVARVKVWLNGILRHDEPWVNDTPLGDAKVGVGTWAGTSSFDNLMVRVVVPAAGRTWYVDGAIASPGDGSTWAKAFKTIQQGIEAASHGDVVIAAGGTYRENIFFKGKNVTLRSRDPLDLNASNAVIEGNQPGPVITFRGTEDESCVLSGFRITSGNPNPTAEVGGGICGGTEYAHTHATIRNNWIFGNSAYTGGGGLAFCDGAIENNAVEGNSALLGGGLFDCDGPIVNNRIRGNTATGALGDGKGGGLAHCDGPILNNTISGNAARGSGFDSEGGGLFYCGGPIVKNVIEANEAYAGGGLSECDGPILSNAIAFNKCATYGGGLYSCGGAIQNNTIFGNSGYEGGGVAGCNGPVLNNIICGNVADFGAGLTGCHGPIHNNTIYLNAAIFGNGGGLFECRGSIHNCIIWANTIPQLLEGRTPSYSCIEGWPGGGEGNIALDPQFVDFDGPDDNQNTYPDNNYRLKPTSPCIDAGKNEPWMTGAVDADGNPRIFYGKLCLTADMGAYEYGSFPFKIVGLTTINGHALITWESRPGDAYIVWSSTDLLSRVWTKEDERLSEGYSTTWADPFRAPIRKFYRIELK